MSSRIIYNWADIYSQQLKSGQDYGQLSLTYSIWLLAENLLAEDKDYAHHNKMRDDQGRAFNRHGGIWLLELNKFDASRIETEDQRWLKFFKDGEQLNDTALPDWMSTQEMKQAMNTLTTFSEKEQQYYQYQARQEYLREQRSIQLELELTNRALLQERLEKEAAQRSEMLALQEKQAALIEIEQLKAQLAAKNH